MMNRTLLQARQHIALTALAACLASAGVWAQSTAAPAATTGTTGSAAPSGTTGSKAATAGRSSELERSERKFVEMAATGGLMEVQMGEAARQKAANAQVKAYGERMVQDHGKANAELKQIVSSKGISLPATLERAQLRDVQRMEKLQGAAFDREYMKHMVSDHKKDISAFEKQAKSGKDLELKAFAAKTLPVLQEHLKLAQTAHDAVKNAK